LNTNSRLSPSSSFFPLLRVFPPFPLFLGMMSTKLALDEGVVNQQTDLPKMD
jgi:hypothetical protein